MKKMLAVFSVLLFASSFAFAATGDIASVTAPLTKIYDLAKAAVSLLGVIALTVIGAIYMFSGNNIQTRETAKSMATYAVVGLVLVWVAPFLVSYLTAPAV